MMALEDQIGAKKDELNGLVQEGRKWLFQVKFFSFKSAWIFACAF